MKTKHKFYILSFLAIVVSVFSFSTASSLFSSADDNKEIVFFSFDNPVNYYLKGSFNSWNQSDTYKFVNNTSSMSSETNKVAEYVLNNVSLSKGAELKAWGDNDTWCSTFTHSWTNSVQYNSSNYVVPMSSNTYSFTLKVYKDNSTSLYITANKDILFLIPSNNWKQSGAKFAIEQYNNTGPRQNIITGIEVTSGVFKMEIGTTYPKYRFARRNSDNSDNWNVSNIQTISNSDTNNCFSLWDTYHGSSTGVWSDWDPNGNCGSWSSR